MDLLVSTVLYLICRDDFLMKIAKWTLKSKLQNRMLRISLVLGKDHHR